MGIPLFLILVITVTFIGTLTCFVCDLVEYKQAVLKIDTDFLNNRSLDSIEDWLTY